MKFCVLKGSPRPNGNTNALLPPFIEELTALGHEVDAFSLYDMDIRPCTSCRECQKDWSIFGCVQNDDVHALFDEIMNCDVIVLASPVYSWYCTPPMKSLLDRLVYGMNKYYGDAKGPALWAGKEMALITTCGYRPEKGADLWEEGMKRYCKHSGLIYRGMLAERFLGYNTVFMDEEKAEHARAFAAMLCDNDK